ncbi:MAG: Cobalt/zinc/cadmium efflux transporter [Burkholderia sp.]|nr:Cobalt/zinc/cadmium efflux transporter [Burkholderia sp.]
MRRKTISMLVIAIALAGAGWYWFEGRTATVASQPTEPHANRDEASALVQTESLKKQPLAATLTVFGEVQPGRVIGISFARPGQVARVNVIAGQKVRQGTELATLASDPGTELNYAQANNALGFAQRELERMQGLLSLQLATTSQVDAARKAVVDAQASLATQKKLGAGTGTAGVTAPFDGVITAVTAAQGDRVQPGAPILQLGVTGSLRVQLGVEPEKSRSIHAGMPVRLAAVQNPRQEVPAKVADIQDVVDPKSQLVNVIAMLSPDLAREFVPGMRVQGTIETGQQEMWAVARSAVLTDEKGPYLFQVDHGKARRVALGKTIESGNLIGIDGQVDPALPVVVVGNYELQDGMAVRGAAQ